MKYSLHSSMTMKLYLKSCLRCRVLSYQMWIVLAPVKFVSWQPISWSEPGCGLSMTNYRAQQQMAGRQTSLWAGHCHCHNGRLSRRNFKDIMTNLKEGENRLNGRNTWNMDIDSLLQLVTQLTFIWLSAHSAISLNALMSWGYQAAGTTCLGWSGSGERRSWSITLIPIMRGWLQY